MPVIPHIVAQYAEQAAFLWLLRDGSTRRPDYTLADLAALDNRIEAHLDGLRIAGEEGWTACAQALDAGQGGEVFAGAIIALESGNSAALGAVCAVVEDIPEVVREFTSALGWLSGRRFSQVIPGLLAAQDALWRRLAIAGCAVRCQDCAAHLTRALVDPDLQLRRRAARAAGELARLDLRPALATLLSDEDPDTCFWAAWSLALLGEWHQAIGPLAASVQTTGPDRRRALQIIARIVAPRDLQHWLKGLPTDLEGRQLLVAGLGAGGDPAVIPWLIERMGDNSSLARRAGAAFTLVTGLDLAAAGLAQPPPAGFVDGPSDNPAEDDVALDPDTRLPWPDAERVGAWWRANGSNYRPAVRYLAGHPVSPEHCWALLNKGRQQERTAAALELALMDPAQILFETRAPAWRQAAWLGARAARG